MQDARERGATLYPDVLDKKPPPTDSNGVSDYMQGDVRTPEDLRKAMVGRDIVYNLAAVHQDNVIPLSLYMDVNVIGARNSCKAVATAVGVKRLIFTSSVAVYGAQYKPMKEDAEHAYFNEYGRTKHLAEAEYEASARFLARQPNSRSYDQQWCSGLGIVATYITSCAN